jgi:hypothetical protein
LKDEVYQQKPALPIYSPSASPQSSLLSPEAGTIASQTK